MKAQTKSLWTLRNTWLVVGVALAVWMSACSAAPAAQNSSAYPMPYQSAPPVAPAAAPAAPAAATAIAEAPTAADAINARMNSPERQQPRLIIRNVDMTIVVSDTQRKLNDVAIIANKYGGYVASSNINKVRDNALQAQMVLRIDSNKLDLALSDIRGLALEIRGEGVRGDDVTAEYVDLDSRVRNLEAAETQLQEILKKAEKTEDVMAVFTQLTEVRGQIEQAKGRMKYLSQSASYATINLAMEPYFVPEQLPSITEPAWSLGKVFEDASKSLGKAMQNLASAGVWLLVFVLPQLLVVLLPLVLLVVLARLLLKKLFGKRVAKV